MFPVGDFHVHTHFCPHGSNDHMEEYVKNAISRDMKFLSFTEHAPLPSVFDDPAPNKDSSMRLEDIEAYFEEGNRLKEIYKDTITIKVGFEVDYLLGFEAETKRFLHAYGADIEDSILSVHMLQAPNGEYVCLDFSPDEFGRIIALFGSIDHVYEAYYETLRQAVEADLGKWKPVRIGHLTLIEKFSKLYQATKTFDDIIEEILTLIAAKQYSLDVNTAGFFKDYCGVTYPPAVVMRQAYAKNIPLIFGSDSHTAGHVGKGLEQIPKDLPLALPKAYEEKGN